MADENTDGPVYAVKRRPDIRMMFKQTATPMPDDLRQEARQVAARMFGLGPETSGPAAPGDHLGPYRVLRVLGIGGQAYVYEAEHAQLGRRVALKVPRKDVAERLLREARMSAKLDHPRMVRVEHVGEHEGPAGTVPYLVMEFLEGGSLDHLLEHHPDGLPMDDVRRIGGAVLEALQYAHSQGVVHRDVKPSNVLFDAVGEPKLSDLGIGTLSSGDLDHSVELSRLTQEGAAVGTPLFMSPEQEDPTRLGAESIDGRADLFSFGKMLFVMLTGASPRTIRPVSRMRSGLDPAWDDFIFKLVEEDREQRFADAEAVKAAMADLPGMPVRVKVSPSDSGEHDGPAITVKEKGVVPVAKLVLPDQPPLGYLIPPGSQRAAWLYGLLCLMSAGFGGWLWSLATDATRWQRKELVPLIVGSLLASFFLWRFRAGEQRAERSLGPVLAGLFSALVAGWQPFLFAGRFGLAGLGPNPGVYYMSRGDFIAAGVGLDIATFALGAILLLVYRWRRRPRPPSGGGPDERRPVVRARPKSAGGIVLRVLGVITGVLTLAGSAVLAVLALCVAALVAILSAVTNRGIDATFDLGALGNWDAGAVTGLVLVVATLIGVVMVVFPLRGLLRREPEGPPQ